MVDVKQDNLRKRFPRTGYVSRAENLAYDLEAWSNTYWNFMTYEPNWLANEHARRVCEFRIEELNDLAAELRKVGGRIRGLP